MEEWQRRQRQRKKGGKITRREYGRYVPVDGGGRRERRHGGLERTVS